MKKQLLLCLSSAWVAAAMAATTPVVLPEFYSMKISADGSVIASEGFESVEIYNVTTGEKIEFPPYRLGSGNCITTDGSIVVGSTESDEPVLIKNGEEVDVTSITEVYRSSNFNAITGDGHRVIGWVFNNALDDADSNSDEGGTMYVPMYVDINEDGSFGEVNLLPYPAKDWLGQAPQYITASFVSNDGKTILGQVIDNTGMYIYPIVFTQAADGEWSYSLITEELINPNKLPLPEYPGEFTEQPVEFQDYMTPEEYQAYQDAYEAWVAGGYEGEYPDFSNYMTPEEIEAFNAAADAYNEKAMEYNEKFSKYFDDLNQISEESTFFRQNAYAMNAEGTVCAMNAQKEVILDPDAEWPTSETQYPTYIINLKDSEIKKIENLGDSKFPHPSQILSDGTVIASTPQPGMWDAIQRPPQGFILLPGDDQYIPVENKIAEINPSAAEWLDKNYKKTITIGYDWDTDTELNETLLMTGHICVSDNWSVITGGVMAYLYNAFEESEEEPNTLESYIITSEINAIQGVEADAKIDTVKYYDMNGMKIKNPDNGIFIKVTSYTDGTVKTSKVVK